MRRSGGVAWGSILLVTALALACDDDTRQGVSRVVRLATGDVVPSLASVRFVNAVQNAPSLVLSLGDSLAAAALPYAGVSPYRDVAPSQLHLSLLAPGASARWDTLATRRERIRPGGRYTVVAMRSDDAQGMTLRLVSDDSPGESSAAHLRLVHAAPLAGALDLMLQGTRTSVFDDVSYANVTDFQRISPSPSLRFAIRGGDEAESPRAAPGIDRVEAGRSYTLVVAGTRSDWQVITITDAVTTPAAAPVPR